MPGTAPAFFFFFRQNFQNTRRRVASMANPATAPTAIPIIPGLDRPGDSVEPKPLLDPVGMVVTNDV
jgi:hypothetical protein